MGNIDTETTKQLLTYLKDAVDLGKEQLPLVVSDIIRYGKISSLYTTATFLGLTAGLTYLTKFFVGKYDDCNEGPFIGSIASIVLGLCTLIITLISISDAIKVFLSPRLYVLEQLSMMLRGK